MSGEVFVDTNVLVYQVDESELEKQLQARRWIEQLWQHDSGRVSVQVLQEFYSTVTRRLSQAVSKEDARRAVRRLGAWNPVLLDGETLEQGFRLEERFELAWWDALIVAAAQAAACRYLLTEDLQHDQTFEGLRVINFQFVRPGEVLGR